MRYLVTAHVKAGKDVALRCAIDDETLGLGSVAGDEYLRNMAEARNTRTAVSNGWKSAIRDAPGRRT